jgi:hypothetical protein
MTCSTHGRDLKCIQDVGGKPSRSPFQRPRLIGEDNIEMIITVFWDMARLLEAAW